MTTLFMIRHGRTDWIGDRLAGQLPDVHLNDDGRAQAEVLARMLGSIPFEAVYSSPLERAWETAQPLARVLQKDIRRTDLLLEVDFGELAGKGFPELRELPVWKQAHSDPANVRFPGGESLREVQQRGVQAAEQIRQAHPKGTVAAVTHSDTIRLLLAFFLQMPLGAYQSIAVDPASVSIFLFTPKTVKILGMNLPPGSPIVLADGK